MSSIRACLFLAALLSVALQSDCAADKPNMMMSFHPHLDPFWHNTQEELRNIFYIPSNSNYYVYNQRNSKLVLNSMLDGLTSHGRGHRRYFISEVYFFRDWYEYLDVERKEHVQAALRSGQLEIVNGGWVENDEGVCYYDDIIEQYTLGMNYLNEEFQYAVRVGWATDSFGHSHSQAALLNELGMEMQVVERTDPRFIYKRKSGPLLEWYWLLRSDSNNLTYGGLLTNLRHHTHEASTTRSNPNGTISVEMRKTITTMSRLYDRGLLFKFYGDDFEEITTVDFENLKKGMDVLNKQYGCEAVHYANPSEYLDALKKYYQDKEVPVRYNDLMPNYERGGYWTGYYTTYPELKKLCRDSSRLLNFFKKALLHAIVAKKLNGAEALELVDPAERLLALMQHHDGITGTSKHHVTLNMMAKLNKSNDNLRKEVQRLYRTEGATECRLYENNNECTLDDKLGNSVEMTILNFGTTRFERLEVRFPANRYFKADQSIPNEIFCYEKHDCRLVMRVTVKPPSTRIILTERKHEEIKGEIVQATNMRSGSFEQIDFTVYDRSALKFQHRNHYIKLRYVQSLAEKQQRQAYAYDKHGNHTELKNANVSSGLYVMANDGKLSNYGGDIKSMSVLKGSNWAKLLVMYDNKVRTTVTLSKHEYRVLNVQTDFTPTAKPADFFLSLESDLQAPEREFYHDANGYLVIKRQMDKRPDYEFTTASGDNINANTYPMTSFAYIDNGLHKLVVSTDRAQGVTLHSNNTLLVNLDRYTTKDDEIGAGEGYTYVNRGIYRHRIALTRPTDNVEREWQKHYDEALLAYLGSPAQAAPPTKSSIEFKSTIHTNYLKLTTSFLNNDTIVVRLQSLSDHTPLRVKLMNAHNEITLKEFELTLQTAGVEESYHNGVIRKPHHRWVDLNEANLVSIHHNKFNGREVSLKPLQIYSFRVKLPKANLRKQP